MMSLPGIRNLLLAPAFVAALLAAAAGSGQPVPPVVVPPPPPPDGTTTFNGGVILTDQKTCGVAYKAANLGSGDIEKQLNAFRSTKYQLPPLKFYPQNNDSGAQQVAHDHSEDMIRKNYISLIDFSKNGKGRAVPKQLRDQQTNFTEVKMIVLVGCFGLTVADAFAVMDSNPATKAIISRPDWTHVGADVHHPDDGFVNPAPGIPDRNYWVFVFYK